MQQCSTAAYRAPRLITDVARTTLRLRPAARCLLHLASRPSASPFQMPKPANCGDPPSLSRLPLLPQLQV